MGNYGNSFLKKNKDNLFVNDENNDEESICFYSGNAADVVISIR